MRRVMQGLHRSATTPSSAVPATRERYSELRAEWVLPGAPSSQSAGFPVPRPHTMVKSLADRIRAQNTPEVNRNPVQAPPWPCPGSFVAETVRVRQWRAPFALRAESIERMSMESGERRLLDGPRELYLRRPCS